MQNSIYQDRYKVTQHLIDNLTIVEIQEIGCDYLDYVVICYDESCMEQKIKSLVDEYKDKNTVCVIGMKKLKIILTCFVLMCVCKMILIL